jgi:hypothetical protein
VDTGFDLAGEGIDTGVDLAGEGVGVTEDLTEDLDFTVDGGALTGETGTVEGGAFMFAEGDTEGGTDVGEAVGGFVDGGADFYGDLGDTVDTDDTGTIGTTVALYGETV